MQISLQRLLSTIYKHKPVVALTFVLVMLLTFGYCLIAAPIYEAGTLLIVEQGDPSRNTNSGQSIANLEEIMNSQVRIAQSEEVIRRAIAQVGPGRLFPDLAGREDADNAAYYGIRSALRIEPEPKTNLIRITVRHPDPQVAAGLANALGRAFIDRSIELYRRPGTAEFFERQNEKFEKQFEEASTELSSFASASGTYSIEDQQKLAIARASQLSAALAGTNSAIAGKEAHIASIADQLLRMKPILDSPIVAGMVSEIADRAKDKSGDRRPKEPAGSAGRGSSIGADPPLLLVRVYQESVQELVKNNAELAELRAQKSQQETELTKINGEIGNLLARGAEFERLKRKVELAAHNAVSYANRAAAEQLESDLSAAKFSRIKVAQSAVTPARPYYPRLSLFLPVGMVIALVLSTALAVVLEQFAGSSPVPARPFSSRNNRVSRGPLPRRGSGSEQYDSTVTSLAANDRRLRS